MSKEGSRCAPLFLLLRLEVPCWLLDIQSFAVVFKQAHAYDPVSALNRLDSAVTFNIQCPTRNTQCPRAAVALLRFFISSVGDSLLSIGYSVFCRGL